MPVLLLAALIASAAPPRLLVVSPEAELRRATNASLAADTSLSLSPTLEGAEACGDVGCARRQALAVNADFVLIVRRTTDGAALRLLDTAEGFVVGAKDIVAPDATTLGASLGIEARALMRIARPEPPPPVAVAPTEAPESAPTIEPPPPPGEPPPPPRPERRPESESDGWGAVGVTIGVVLGLVAIGAAACYGLSAAANGCDNAASDCGNACAGAIACGALAGACISDAPAACDTAVDVCDTGIAVCDTGVSCLNACNGLAQPEDEPDTLIGPPDPSAGFLAMAF